MKIYFILFFAILSEVIGTTALKFSEGFTKLIPSVRVFLSAFACVEVYADWYGVCDLVGSGVGVDCRRGNCHLAGKPRLGVRGGDLLILLGIVFINVVAKVTVN